MAVIKVERLRGGDATYAVPNAHSYTDTYRIYTNSDMARALVLSGAQATTAPTKVPQLLDYHKDYNVTDAAAVCQQIHLRPEQEDKRIWLATCQFGPLQPNQTPLDNVNSPLLKQTKWHVEWLEETAIVAKDASGVPITNTVGDEFDTPIEQPKLFMVLVAEKPYATLQEIIDLGLEYHESVNSVAFKNGPARTVRFLPIQSQQVQFENGIEYYMASLRFGFNPETWDVEVLNRGWRYRPTAGTAPVKAIDKETHLPVSVPVNLAENGTLLAEGATKYYVKRQTYKLKDYNAIF